MKENEFLQFLRSMKVGLTLLGLLSIISIFGSLVPQGQETIYYYRNFSPKTAELIFLFGLNDIYHSFYFIFLFVALGVNLFLCSITRLGHVIKKSKQMPNQAKLIRIQIIKKPKEGATKWIQDKFEAHGFGEFNTREKKNESVYYNTKNNMRSIGSWLTHVGLLLVIIFYAYGQYTYTSTAVYGVPGTEQEVQDTGYMARIHDFTINYREDGSVEQYITELELLNLDGESIIEGQVSVNHPLSYDGYKFYQTSTGWATDFTLRKSDEVIENEVFYESTILISEEEGLAIQFTGFYPDFVNTDRGPMSRSHELNHPKVLYSIFYRGNRVAMNIADPGEVIQWNEFEFQFNEPRRYTYLQGNKMNGKLGVTIGAICMMIGLLVTFYVKSKVLMIVESKGQLIVFAGHDEKYSNKIRDQITITEGKSIDI